MLYSRQVELVEGCIRSESEDVDRGMCFYYVYMSMHLFNSVIS